MLGQVLPTLDLDARSSTFYALGRLLQALMIMTCTVEPIADLRYFDPILDFAERMGDELTIATLNYDNALESRAAARRVELNEPICQPRNGRSTLLKIHGSVSWKEHWANFDADRQVNVPRKEVRLVSDSDDPRYAPVILFGEGKATHDEPFVELYFRFQRAVAEASHITIVGYSFRDEHINTVVDRWQAANPTTTRAKRDLRFVG